MLFYSALHWIDGYLSQKRQKPMDHEERDGVVETNGSLADIYNDYRRLKDMSQQARYEIANYAERDWRLASQRLENIKRHVSSKL